MVCPSCGELFKDSVKHCTHCGIAITRRSVLAAQIIQNFGWIGRRSLGGFFSGGVAWVLAIAVSRTLYFTGHGDVTFTTLLDFFPGKFPVTSGVAGAIIGTVGGMIERSAYKTLLGGLLGALGGFLGALAYPLFEKIFLGQKYAFCLSMAGSWAVASAFVGLTSGLLEGTRRKILVGVLGGILGGALGGGIGSQMYGAILMEMGSSDKMSWAIGRVLEFLGGGVVGVLIWFFIGMTEKLYIFRRRRLVAATHKICDHCSVENGLNAWYCAGCGSALQEAAAREQMHVTPYRGLERLSDAFLFLSWLAASVGVVTTVVLLVSLARQNILFAVFGSLLVGLGIYSLSILFKAVSDTIRIGMKSTDKTR